MPTKTTRIPQHDQRNTPAGHVVNGSLSATLLQMLAEAPGYVEDIALGLQLPPHTVEAELKCLAKENLVWHIHEREGTWYRLANPRDTPRQHGHIHSPEGVHEHSDMP